MPGLVRFWSVMRVLGMGKIAIHERFGEIWSLIGVAETGVACQHGGV